MRTLLVMLVLVGCGTTDLEIESEPGPATCTITITSWQGGSATFTREKGKEAEEFIRFLFNQVTINSLIHDCY